VRNSIRAEDLDNISLLQLYRHVRLAPNAIRRGPAFLANRRFTLGRQTAVYKDTQATGNAHITTCINITTIVHRPTLVSVLRVVIK